MCVCSLLSHCDWDMKGISARLGKIFIPYPLLYEPFLLFRLAEFEQQNNNFNSKDLLV